MDEKGKGNMIPSPTGLSRIQRHRQRWQVIVGCWIRSWMRETERNFGRSSAGIYKVSIVTGGESTGPSLESTTWVNPDTGVRAVWYGRRALVVDGI